MSGLQSVEDARELAGRNIDSLVLSNRGWRTVGASSLTRLEPVHAIQFERLGPRPVVERSEL